jgi:hypothetical protein
MIIKNPRRRRGLGIGPDAKFVLTSSDPIPQQLPACRGTADQISAAAAQGLCDPNALPTDTSVGGGINFLSQQLYALQNQLAALEQPAGAASVPWIQGVPNWAVAVAGALGFVLVLGAMSGGRR